MGGSGDHGDLRDLRVPELPHGFRSGLAFSDAVIGR
jgi:hypothetical protein